MALMAFVSVTLLWLVTSGKGDDSVLTVFIAPSYEFISWPASEGRLPEPNQVMSTKFTANTSDEVNTVNSTTRPDYIIEESHLLDFFNNVYSQSSALIVFIDLRHEACPLDLFRQRLLGYITMSVTHCPSLSDVITRAALPVNTWSLNLLMFMPQFIASWKTSETVEHFHTSFALFFDKSGEDHFLLPNRVVTSKLLFEVTLPLTDCRNSDYVTQLAAQTNNKDVIVIALTSCIYDLMVTVSRLHLPSTRFRWLLYPTDYNETFQWDGVQKFLNSASPIFLTERGRSPTRPVYSHAKLLNFANHVTTSFLSALRDNTSKGSCQLNCTTDCAECQSLFGERLKEIPGQLYEVYTSHSQSDKNSIVFDLNRITLKSIVYLGNWSQDRGLKVEEVLYPRSFINTQLSVVVVVEPPFVFRNNSENGVTSYYGYSIDVLKEISSRLSFSYTLSECDSGGYGMLYKGRWTGCIGNVVRGEADVILGALTVTAERDQVIDFTLPYYSFAGIQILMKKQTVNINLFYYANVFTTPAWLSLASVVAVTCILLWIFERITCPKIRKGSYSVNTPVTCPNPISLSVNGAGLELSTISVTKNPANGGSNGCPSNDGTQISHVTSTEHVKVRTVLEKNSNDDNMDVPSFPDTTSTLAESSWYVIGALAMAGGGDPPTSFSGRLLIAGFWFFAVIMMSTFTANLAAFLTVSRMGMTITSLDDLARQTDIKYTVVNQTNVMEYFQRMAQIEKHFYEQWKTVSLDRSADNMEDSLAVWKYPLGNKYDAMWASMKQTGLLQSNQVGLERVMSESFALITESPLIQYYTGKNCDLMSVGEQFSIRPYAIGLKKWSPYASKFSDAILDLQKERVLGSLILRWWENSDVSCPKETGKEGLDLYSLSGTFVVAAAGVACGLIVLGLEHLASEVKKRRRSSSLEVNGIVLPEK